MRQTIKLLRDNIGNYLQDFRGGKNVLRYKITNQKEKNDKFNYIKIKNSPKNTRNRKKLQQSG